MSTSQNLHCPESIFHQLQRQIFKLFTKRSTSLLNLAVAFPVSEFRCQCPVLILRRHLCLVSQMTPSRFLIVFSQGQVASDCARNALCFALCNLHRLFSADDTIYCTDNACTYLTQIWEKCHKYINCHSFIPSSGQSQTLTHFYGLYRE